MHIKWRALKYRKKTVLGLIIFAAVSYIFLIWLEDNGTNNKLQPNSCANAIQNWFHYNKTLVNRKIITKLKGITLNNSIYISRYRWQEAVPHIYIYSAFKDSCDFPENATFVSCVKIVSVVLRSHSVFNSMQSQLVCFIKDRNSIKYTNSTRYTIIKEHHGNCFGAAFIDCLLPFKHRHQMWISVGKHSEHPVAKWVPTFQYNSQMKEVAVCVRPLYGPFNSSLQLVEFISYYTEAGVEQFYFYDQSIAPEISQLLELLSRHGKAKISLLQWKFPLDDELVHENGQLAHIQDCILRCRNEFKHAILVDVDEYVVPRQQKTLIEMLKYLDKKYSNAGTYIFPMALFCDEYLHEMKEEYSVLPFITHMNIWRQKTLWYYQERSKVIVKPNAVKVGGIHFTWEHVNNKYREIQIPSDVAIVHHYRQCCGMTQTWFFHRLSFRVLTDERMEDKSLIAFKKKMLENPIVKLMWKLIL